VLHAAGTKPADEDPKEAMNPSPTLTAAEKLLVAAAFDAVTKLVPAESKKVYLRK
jgi:hypothetical protein